MQTERADIGKDHAQEFDPLSYSEEGNSQVAGNFIGGRAAWTEDPSKETGASKDYL